MKNASRIAMCLIALCLTVASTGCSMVMQPFEEPVFVEAGNADSTFVMPMTGDTADQVKFDKDDLIQNRLIAAKRIRVQREWVQDERKWFFGLGPYHGYYIPDTRVVTVDRSPVTVNWSKDTNNGIWVESSDSVGFSTGIGLTGRIANDEDAAVFLSNYPSVKIGTNTVASPIDYHVTANLTDVLNEEVRERAQMVFARYAAAYEMDNLRGKKVEILDAIEKDIVPFFHDRGITITTVSLFGGFEFENPKIQDAIDKVFQAQQDKQVAIAEAEAATERKEALRLIGEGKAEGVKAEAQGKADAIQTLADAKKYEADTLTASEDFFLQLKVIEVQERWLDKWDGRLPVYSLQTGGEGGQAPGMLMQLPAAGNVQK